MKIIFFFLLILVLIYQINSYSIINPITKAFNTKIIRRTTLYERKRRTKIKRNEDNKITNVNTSTITNTNTDTNDIIITPSVDDNVFEGKIESRLSPIVGTAAAKQAAIQEKGVLKTQIDELLAPTPAGKEPKIIQLAKNITWFSVIVLVLIEIFVSIKTGGAPFKVNEGTTSETVIERPRIPSLYDLSPSE